MSPIQRSARRCSRLCWSAGGPTDVELVGATAELAHRGLAHDFRRINPTSTRIILVEWELSIIPTFPASLTCKARKKLEQFGVEVSSGGADAGNCVEASAFYAEVRH